LECMSNVPSAWTAAEIKRVGYHVIDLIAEYLSTLADGSIFRAVPMNLAAKFLSPPAPVSGTDSDRILAELRETVAPYPFGNGHPRF
jgi:aromatic-L-amino-acid decarboxylase